VTVVLVSGAAPAGARVSDAWISTKAKMEAARVNVEINAATARLTGTVQHASQRYAAVAIAHATPGVARVENDLRIEAKQTSQR
jgi:osmotically-inducible protein OsmY